MTKPHEQIELRNDEVNDILSQMPSWTIRWGTLALAGVIFLLIGLTFLIRYPDTIKGMITITSQKIPVDLVAKKSGRITHLAVKEGQIVHKGTDLAVIESEITYEDFLKVEKTTSDFYNCLLQDSTCNLLIDNYLQVGNLQNSFPQYTFSQFKKAYQEYAFFIQNPFVQKEIQNLQSQINSLEKLKEQAFKEKSILEKNASIAQKQYQRDKKLNENKVYSDADAENTEKIYLQEHYKAENLQSQYLNYDLRISQVQKNVQELEKQDSWRKQELYAQLKAATERLQTDLQLWRENHILEAKMDGKISLGKFWAENQYINAGEVLLSLSPLEKEMMGYIFVDANGFGKIQTGQKVLICLYAFDCQEYGKIEARVQNISDVLVEGRYRVGITFSMPLKTINNFAIPLQTNTLQGDAYVQTDNALLIEKVFYQLRFLLQKYF